MLDAAAQAHWARHGWVWLRGLPGADETRELARWTDEIAAWPETPGPLDALLRAPRRRARQKMLARIENFVPYHAGLAALRLGGRACSTLLAHAARRARRALQGQDQLQAARRRRLRAAPGRARLRRLRRRAPRDAHGAGRRVHAPRTAASRWRATRARATFLPQNPDGTLRDDVMDALEVESLLAEPGDVIVFDAWVPHRSGPNRSRGAAALVLPDLQPGVGRRPSRRLLRAQARVLPARVRAQAGRRLRGARAQFNLGNPFD